MDSVTILGVIFDSTLSWRQQSMKIIRKCFAMLAHLRRNFLYIPMTIRKRVVQNLIFPCFDYYSALYTDMPETVVIKLQRVQNACICFVTGSGKFEHITPIYKELNILKLKDRRTVALASLLSVVRNKTPAYLYNRLTFKSDIYSRQMRANARNLHIPNHKTDKFHNSFSIIACRVWNYLNLANYTSVRVDTVKAKDNGTSSKLILK